jgi:hypothetical protein
VLLVMPTLLRRWLEQENPIVSDQHEIVARDAIMMSKFSDALKKAGGETGMSSS